MLDNSAQTRKKFYIAAFDEEKEFPLVKVGISKNPYARMPQLKVIGIHRPRLLCFFEFEDSSIARQIEAEILAAYGGCRFHHASEALEASYSEIVDFIHDWYQPIKITECALGILHAWWG